MSGTPSTDKSSYLSDLSPYIYGTTRLGDTRIPLDDRIRITQLALDAGVWFHTSHTYGNALEVIRAALDQSKRDAPKLIVKLIGSTIDDIRNVLRQNLEPLGIDSLELGQLCLGGQLADEFAFGGDCYEQLARLKDEGRVRRYVVEVFPWTSEMSLRALRKGLADNLVDGYIFYLNPLQRFANNALWNLLMERNEPIIAMRTVSGGNVFDLRDVPGAAWQPYLQERATQVAPLFERSGIPSWTEFCVRFVHSFDQVRATVGATSRPDNLQEFLSAVEDIQPLPDDIMDEIKALQVRWSDAVDTRAQPWSM